MPSTHTADFQTAALKATDLEAVEKINVGLETELARKQLNIIADAPEIRIQDKTGSASETTMSIVADGGATHFRAGIDTFAEGTETKGNVKFQSSTGATTHAEIVGSSGTLELQDGGLALKLGSNVSVTGTSSVIQEITGPHARDVVPLRKYPEVAFAEGKFDTTDNEIVSTYWAGHSTVFQGGYSVKTSHHSKDDGGQYGWHVFDDNPETIWKNAEDYNSSTGNYDYGFTNVQSRLTDTNSTNHDGDHVIMGSPSKLKIVKVSVTCKSSIRRVVNYSVLGSNSTGTTGWTLLDSGSFAAQDANIATITSPTTHFKYHAFVVRSVTAGVNGQRFQINSIHYYGYDEDVGAGDDSVDVTFKSVYNSPDLTNAALYIDAAKTGTSVTDQSGSTPSVTVTATGVTHDSTEKAWELTGAATSNIVSGDLTSLVGDQPHSVSAWVKADQLNGDGLFHVGTSEGEGDAASRVGFVDDSHISWGGEDHFFSNAEWHNVTYTYNGEGSDKKLYLDGRLVGTAANEDTFGDYPPFAMSTYSEYGYTVSVSSTYSSSDRQGWNAFDDNPSTANPYRWVSGDHYVNGVYTRSPPERHVDVDGNAEDGEWLKIQMPHKLKVSYFGIKANPTSGSQSWRDYAILGSHDNVNWYQIQKVSGLGVGNGLTGGSNEVTVVPTGTYKNSAFKYFVFIWHNKANDVNGHVSMGEMRIFGHRENDLVRFPDSVNVLKYPHVAMTGPAQRGYVVEGSSRINYTDVEYEPWKSFGWSTPGTQSPYDAGWVSLNTSYSTSSPYNANSNESLSGIDGVGSRNGAYLTVTFPRKLAITKFDIYSRSATTDARVTEGYIYGSQDKTTWYEIAQISVDSTNLASYTNTTPCVITTDSTTAYRYAAIQATSVGNSAGYISYGKIELYGTEEDLDVIARVGDGFDGKVRNLRVYSTALSDARVQEIFDADKDEFGLAKSSVSVYRGHLGVGTDTPKAALTVMDEVAELEEFPPSAMTAEETYIEGHGVFGLHHSGYNASGPIIRAFNKKAPFGDFWYSNTSIYQGTGNLYSGSAISPNGVAGEWMYMTLPYHVDMKYLEITARNGEENSAPNTAIIFGSADGGVTWEQVGGWSGKTTSNHWLGSGVPSPPFTINSTKPLNAIGFVVTHGNSWYAFTLGEIRFFGARERGASTLHNGELSLTRNLTVPRIGPPLDADDTPRRDRLVVEYNTSTNPMENGVVKDTSGRGLDGLLDNTYGGAAYNPYYDASEKALVFDGSNDYVFQNDVHLKTGVGGMYSASVWVRNRASSGTHTVYSLGTYAQLTTSTLYVLDTTLQVVFYNSDLNVTYTIPKNTWTHIVVTHAGGATSTTTKMYINGVDVGLAAASGTSYPLSTVNFPSPCNLFLGKNSTNSVYGGPMDLSNFKLYDVALTADEVKRLYDMGRLGNVIAQPVHIAAPLYAPGTIVQVESSTKYDTFSATGLNTHPLSPGNDVPGLSVTIHPKFANSKILISYDVNMGSYGRAYLRIQRTQGGNVTAIEAPIGPAGSTTEGKSTSSTTFGSTTNTEVRAASFTHYDDANSTVPITYQIQAWTYHSTYYVHINRAHQDHNGTTNNSTYWARTLSSITAKEVCQ